MSYRLLSPAENDLREATRYYEGEEVGLGLEFLSEFEAVISRVCQFPEGWKLVSRKHRRCLFRRFPFAVLYSIGNGEVIVSGVMDLRRDPWHQKQRESET